MDHFHTVWIKEEKRDEIHNDASGQPTEKIENAYVEEENVEMQVPDDQDICDPLRVKKEDLKYEEMSQNSGFDRESSSVETNSCTDGSGNPAMTGGMEARMGDSVRYNAELEDSRGNEGTLRWSVLGSKMASAQLQDLEEQRYTCSGNSLLSCSVCLKTFQTRDNLKRHLRVHTGERPYSCDVCGKTFSYSSHCKNHSLLHTGVRPYSCGVCGKTFSQSTHLKTHSLLHTGERPYSCSACSKTFTDRTNLKRHVLLHTGERPYSCSVCSMTFRDGANLKRHSLVHTGKRPYSCTVCSKTFRQPSNLKKHSLLHTGERPYSCSVCSKTFTSSSALKTHSETHRE